MGTSDGDALYGINHFDSFRLNGRWRPRVMTSIPRPCQRSGYEVLPSILSVDRHRRQGSVVLVCATPGDSHGPGGKECRKFIPASLGKGVIAPATATALRASSHFRRFDVGDPDAFAIAGADGVAVMNIGDAGRGDRHWGVRPVQGNMSDRPKPYASHDDEGELLPCTALAAGEVNDVAAHDHDDAARQP